MTSPAGNPVVISAALTGVLATRDQCPAIPYTPVEIAEEAKRAADAGAAIVHIHARSPEGGPEWGVETFALILSEVRARTDVMVNFSTGAIGIPVEERVAHIRELRPEIGALNMGSMNYAKYSRRRGDFVFKAVFENSFERERICVTFARFPWFWGQDRASDPACATANRTR